MRHQHHASTFINTTLNKVTRNIIFDNIFYVAPNNGGTAGEPAIHEFAFADANGAIKYPAGNYTINPPSAKKQIVIDANGVITSIINCP